MRIVGTDSAWRPLQFQPAQSLREVASSGSVQVPFRLNGSEPARRTGDGDPSFLELLRGALDRVNDAQQAADRAIAAVATGDAEDLHEAVIAVEQADLALRLTAQVTQRALEAYREVSRMQI